MTNWNAIDTAPEGRVVLTKIDDEHGERNVQRLVKRTRIPGKTRPLFWSEDQAMYVYYTRHIGLSHDPAAAPRRRNPRLYLLAT